MKHNFKHPLMKNNISSEDFSNLRSFLKKEPILTNHIECKKFEIEWSKWLGVKYSVFVNSGSSANFVSMLIMNHLYPKGGEIIVPPLTWVSDIVSVIKNNFKPVFVDINPLTLSLDTKKTIAAITKNTKGIFITHCQGFNGLTDELLTYLKKKKIALIEDVCESHGAFHKKRKCGSLGLMSNFSYYYAHHMTTIEGGMISTNDKNIYDLARMFRGHGLVRELENSNLKNNIINNNKNLNPEFIFQVPGFNFRNNEIGGYLGRKQLKKLDQNIVKRNNNHNLFLELLDKNIYRTNFYLSGASNYAFNIVLQNKYKNKVSKLMQLMNNNGIEFRRGSAGGGNQMRQPYIKKYISQKYTDFREVEHIHKYGFYIGNYPGLTKNSVRKIAKILNSLGQL